VAPLVERLFQVWKVDGWIPGWVMQKTEKLTPVASLVNIYHLRPTTGLGGPVSV